MEYLSENFLKEGQGELKVEEHLNVKNEKEMVRTMRRRRKRE
jgi:hypothetical protein